MMNNAPPINWAKSGTGDDLTALPTGIFLSNLAKPGHAPRLKCSLEHAKGAVRNAMHLGYLKVLRVGHDNPEQIANDCKAAGDKSEKAAAALDDLLSYLGPDSRRSRDLEVPILTGKGRLNGDLVQGFHKRARKEALVLLKALAVMRRLEKTARKREVAAGKLRMHIGKPEHTAFFLPLTEVWVLITGCQPGSNPNIDRNPFLRFCEIAWADVFDPERKLEPPGFTGALRKFQKHHT